MFILTPVLTGCVKAFSGTLIGPMTHCRTVWIVYFLPLVYNSIHGGERMSVFQTEKQKYLQMIYKNNVVIAKDEERIIVVHSKRTIKPLLPFELTQQVLDEWRQRDSRIAFTETPYKDLFAPTVTSQQEVVCITDFNDIEFSEE
jgi:hypothetical protein